MYVCVEGKQVRCGRRDQVWMLFFLSGVQTISKITHIDDL